MAKDRTKKTTFEKTLSVFAWFFFSIAIITALLSVFSSLSSEKNGKEIFGYKMLIVASDSMSKSALSQNESVHFDAGDLIIAKTTKDNTKFKVGDVITFVSYNPDSYGKTLTHKIREVNYTAAGKLIGYTTYGINTGVSDKALVSPDSIIGEYSGKIPKLGHVFAYLKTPAGYYLSILIPTILLIIFFSINVGKYFGIKEGLKENQYVKEYEGLLERVVVLEALIKGKTNNEVELTETPSKIVLTSEETTKLNIKGNNISFAERLLGLDQSVQDYFNTIHNQLISYKKVNDRVSFKCVSYRHGRKLLAKMTVRGKTLKLHLALDVDKFNKNVFFQKNMSNVKAYEEVPFTVKVKSSRAEKNAVKLVEALMEENAVMKKQNYADINQLETLKKK